MIQVENLRKRYPGRPPVDALSGVSFEIKAGEFVAIMGRSGSGKSTLLHQLGLIDTPSHGHVLIDNEDVLSFSEAQKTLYRLRHLGYVFQEYALLLELTALENVCLPGMALGNDSNGCRQRALDLLYTVGLAHRKGHYPSELSGGEQQRVAIARSLINHPKILFADEPCANLDSISSQTVLELFQKLNREQGQTIVMVSHEPEDTRYVHRVIWLKDGQIERIEGND